MDDECIYNVCSARARVCVCVCVCVCVRVMMVKSDSFCSSKKIQEKAVNKKITQIEGECHYMRCCDNMGVPQCKYLLY